MFNLCLNSADWGNVSEMVSALAAAVAAGIAVWIGRTASRIQKRQASLSVQPAFSIELPPDFDPRSRLTIRNIGQGVAQLVVIESTVREQVKDLLNNDLGGYAFHFDSLPYLRPGDAIPVDHVTERVGDRQKRPVSLQALRNGSLRLLFSDLLGERYAQEFIVTDYGLCRPGKRHLSSEGPSLWARVKARLTFKRLV